MICPVCKKKMEDDAIFCEECGTPTEKGLLFGQNVDDEKTENFSNDFLKEANASDDKKQKENINRKVHKDYNKNTDNKKTSPIYKKDKLKKPLTLLNSIVLVIIFFIPVINLIFAFIWSFKNNINKNRQNISRAFLIVMFIILLLAVIWGYRLVPTLKQLLFTNAS